MIIDEATIFYYIKTRFRIRDAAFPPFAIAVMTCVAEPKYLDTEKDMPYCLVKSSVAHKIQRTGTRYNWTFILRTEGKRNVGIGYTRTIYAEENR